MKNLTTTMDKIEPALTTLTESDNADFQSEASSVVSGYLISITSTLNQFSLVACVVFDLENNLFYQSP